VWSDEDHTKVVLNARDTLLLSTTRSGKGAQNFSRYAPVIKLDSYASCLRRDSAWRGGVSVLITPTPATSWRRVVSRDKVQLIGSQWRSAQAKGTDGCRCSWDQYSAGKKRGDWFPVEIGHRALERSQGNTPASVLPCANCTSAMLWSFMFLLVQGVSNT
jgi:hypothetical protein